MRCDDIPYLIPRPSLKASGHFGTSFISPLLTRTFHGGDSCVMGSSASQVRLVCMLLQTCGGYFHKGSAARKLDRFLAYFQRYILAKPPLPLDIDFDVQVLLCLHLSSLRSFRPAPLHLDLSTGL